MTAVVMTPAVLAAVLVVLRAIVGACVKPTSKTAARAVVKSERLHCR